MKRDHCTQQLQLCAVMIYTCNYPAWLYQTCQLSCPKRTWHTARDSCIWSWSWIHYCE